MKKILNFKNLKLGFLIFIEVIKRNKISLALSLVATALIFFAQYKFKLFYDPNSISIGLIGTYQEYDLPLEVTRLISQS